MVKKIIHKNSTENKTLLWPAHKMSLNMLPQLSIGARGLHFGLSIHLFPCFGCAISKGSGETANLCRLI